MDKGAKPYKGIMVPTMGFGAGVDVDTDRLIRQLTELGAECKVRQDGVIVVAPSDPEAHARRLLDKILYEEPVAESLDDKEIHDFNCEPNRKERGHVKPFYRKGRW